MTQLNPLPTEEEVPAEDNQQLRNASRLAVIDLGFAFIGAIPLIFLAWQLRVWQIYALFAIICAIGALAFGGLRLIRGGRIRPGMFMVITGTMIVLPFTVLLVSDLGLMMGLLIAVISYVFASQTLQAKDVRRILAAGIVIGILVAATDFLNLENRLQVPLFKTLVPVNVTLVLLAVGFFIARRAWRGNLRYQLLAAFIGVTVVATGALGAYMITASSNNLQDNLERELSDVAISRAVRVGDLFNEQINQLTTLSLDNIIRESVEEQNRSYEGGAAAIQTVLDARDTQWRAADSANNDRDFLVRQNLTNVVADSVADYQEAFPQNIEIFVTDVYGGLAGSTNRTSDYYQADEGWWQAAYANGAGAVYIGQPEYDESAGAIGVNIALPLRDHQTGEIIGIMRTTYLVSALVPILADNIGETGSFDLFIPGETVSHIHEGGLEETVPGLFEQLQAVYGQGMVELVYEDELSVVTQAPVQTLKGNPDIDNLGWVVAFHQHRDEAFAPVDAAIQGFIIVLLIVVALAAAAAYFVSQLLVRPIIQLTTTAEEVSTGNLDSRAKVTATNEIGTLATAFNSMTSQLQETLQGLEQRVTERTQNLELAAEVGRSVSQVRELDIMMRDACELILKEFDLYYVQVYLTNPSQTALQLQAGTGEVGVQLLERGHSLQFNTGSINGRAAVEKRSVVISDTAQSATFRPNLLLPETRGEMAVPLIVGEKVVGVLDMQTIIPGNLNEEILPAFEALAGQLAVAIQNANLVAEAQEARAEVEKQARRLVRASWDEHLDAIHKPEKIGFVFDRNEVTPLDEADVFEPSDENQAVSAPISLTGEELGSLVVEINEENQNENTVELVNLVARQVAQQIENLRLLESAERYRYESEQAARRQTREGWQEYIDARAKDSLGYIYDLNEVRPHSNGQDDANALTLPLKARDETVGKLSVQGINSDDRDSVSLVNAVAERLGAHIDNLRLSEQMEQSLALTDELYGISQSMNEAVSESEMLEALARPAAKAGAVSANLMYIDADADGNPEWTEIVADWRLEGEAPIPIGTRFYLPQLPFAKLWMADPNSPLMVSDVNTDARLDDASRAAMQQGGSKAITIIPLTRGQERVGLVTINWDQPHEFKQNEKETYTAIIGLASPAVHSRRLFEQAQKQAERETMLNTISQKIQSATSVEAVLQIAARELGHALGAPMTVAQLNIKDQ